MFTVDKQHVQLTRQKNDIDEREKRDEREERDEKDDIDDRDKRGDRDRRVEREEGTMPINEHIINLFFCYFIAFSLSFSLDLSPY